MNTVEDVCIVELNMHENQKNILSSQARDEVKLVLSTHWLWVWSVVSVATDRWQPTTLASLSQ